MMLKILAKTFGLLLAIVLLYKASNYGYDYYYQRKYADLGIPYIERIISDLCTFEERFVADFMEKRHLAKTPKAPETLEKLRELGRLTDFKRPRLEDYSEVSQGKGPPRKSLLYSVPATFRGGDATLMLRLLETEPNEFQLAYLKVDSKAVQGAVGDPG